jgi:hypothetical protein
MSLQTLTVKLDDITAGDYLTWCRDPDPPALDFGLRSIRIHGDPLGDTITATLDRKGVPPAPPIDAPAAGLPLPAGTRIHALMRTDVPHRDGDKSFARELNRPITAAALDLLEMMCGSADVGKNAALGLPVQRAAFRPASSRRSVEVPVERQQEVAPVERHQ